MIETGTVANYGERGLVIVVRDAEELSVRAADTFRTIANTAIYGRGHAYIALSGGSTPKAMGQLLANVPYSSNIPWRFIDIFWGDERWVPLESDESNAGVAKRGFLDKVAIPQEQVHPFATFDLDPIASAAQMEAKIRATLPTVSFPPQFDLILLGMGDDGHTASLFPGTRAIHEDENLVVSHEIPKLNSLRLTFTPRLINAARQVVFLAAGPAKAEVLKQVLEGEFQPDLLPSQIVRPVNGTLVWIVDEAAASALTKKRGS
jgi:6-phosphogluconolactonase